MGYGITPYAVPLAKLRRACGSKDGKLVRAALDDCARLAAAMDESWRDEISQGAPNAAAAVARLVDGAPSRATPFAFAYPYALEVLCCHLGTPLDAFRLGRTRTEVLQRIERALQSHGVDAFSTSNFTTGPAPVKLPRHGWPPGIGTVEPDAVKRGLAQLEKIQLTVGEAEDEGVSLALEEIKEWLAAARAIRGGGLVCFYY